jgi:dephospho-CoA kinase
MSSQALPYSGVVGLTGSIGSGKTTTSALFQKLGAYVVSADALAKQATKPGADCLQEIREHFGDSFILPSGELNRKRLASNVFSNPAERLVLEAIIHPRVANLAIECFKHAPPGAVVIYDCPLLFEAGLANRGFRKIILVTTPTEAAISRICARSGLTRSEAMARLEAQMPLNEKIARADIVIDNSGSLQDLERRVSEVYLDLLA